MINEVTLLPIDSIPRDQLTKKYQEHIRAIDKRIGENDPKEELIYKARIQNIIDRIKANKELGINTIYIKEEEQDIIYNLLTRALG